MSTENARPPVDGIVAPRMVNTDKRWWNSFGRVEREATARLFTKACQSTGSWKVTREQLDAVEPRGRFLFNGLLGEWITDCGDGTYEATHRFVCHVYGNFPAA